MELGSTSGRASRIVAVRWKHGNMEDAEAEGVTHASEGATGMRETHKHKHHSRPGATTRSSLTQTEEIQTGNFAAEATSLEVPSVDDARTDSECIAAPTLRIESQAWAREPASFRVLRLES